jgi:hypothetical protein
MFFCRMLILRRGSDELLNCNQHKTESLSSQKDQNMLGRENCCSQNNEFPRLEKLNKSMQKQILNLSWFSDFDKLSLIFIKTILLHFLQLSMAKCIHMKVVLNEFISSLDHALNIWCCTYQSV